MARMHSRKKGKSGSKKPVKKTLPSWLKYKPKEVELLILKFAKDGKSPSQIGIFLRDTYGIGDVEKVTKKSITKILKEKKALPKVPEDLKALIKKEVLIRKHLETNRGDEPANRGLQLTVSKIKRLVRYYKKKETLPMDWTYDPAKANLYID